MPARASAPAASAINRCRLGTDIVISSIKSSIFSMPPRGNMPDMVLRRPPSMGLDRYFEHFAPYFFGQAGLELRKRGGRLERVMAGGGGGERGSPPVVA